MNGGQPEWHNKLRQEGLDDMTLIARVNEESILENLYKRFMKDIIYTNIGDVLVSMNPFYAIPGLYEDSVINDYCGKSRLELPPHIYAIAEQAYRSMMVDKENQCVIISGESGAGKTECAKAIMRYIAAVSGGSGEIDKVKRIILETNPLLESFGNAKTLRNNNSSRFGKYFEIQFNCLAGDTLVTLADGTARRIEELVAADFRGTVLAPRYDLNNVAPRQCSETVRTGEFECVTLTLADGRELVLTPDHRIMLHKADGAADVGNGFLPAAQLPLCTQLASGEYKTLDGDAEPVCVAVAAQVPVLDEIDAKGDAWFVREANKACALAVPMSRVRALAFARLLGAAWAARAKNLSLATKYDCEAVCRDIALLFPRERVQTKMLSSSWSLAVPAVLRRVFADLGVALEQRADLALPAIIADDRCGAAFVREFVAAAMARRAKAVRISGTDFIHLRVGEQRFAAPIAALLTKLTTNDLFSLTTKGKLNFSAAGAVWFAEHVGVRYDLSQQVRIAVEHSYLKLVERDLLPEESRGKFAKKYVASLGMTEAFETSSGAFWLTRDAVPLMRMAAIGRRDAGVREVFDLSIKKDTTIDATREPAFVANGVAVHNSRGDPDGGRITNYLLEKSRVVGQLNGERNYHVFYQWTKAGSAEEKGTFGIQSPEQFEYLIRGQCVTVNGLDDNAEYRDMRQAMNVIGITQQEQRDIFTLLAAILWIGNCALRETGGNAQVVDMGVVDFVASLLGVGSQYLKAAFEVRTVETKKGLKRGSTYKVPLNYVQAIASRDALAKTVYDRVFDWLVNRVNQAMYKAADGLVIGVLDIFGFEIFDKNGFEQLCINYVNEKLQQIFIEFTLKNEQDEYAREGIQWTPIPFFNNKVVCDLIEAKSPPGVMLVLDDVCKCLARGTSVLLADGSCKPVEKITRADALMGDDGQPRKVLQLFSGQALMVTVSPLGDDKWAPFVCTSNHVLCVKVNGFPSYKFAADQDLHIAQFAFAEHDATGVCSSLSIKSMSFATAGEAFCVLAAAGWAPDAEQRAVLVQAISQAPNKRRADGLLQFAGGLADAARAALDGGKIVDAAAVKAVIASLAITPFAATSGVPVLHDETVDIQVETVRNEAKVPSSLTQCLVTYAAPGAPQIRSAMSFADAGVQDFFGFELDGNRRFVLGEQLIVTHNSVHAMAEGADKAFMQRVTSAGGGSHPHFQLRGLRFNIKHYAGDVQYDIEGMVEKNKDSLYKDLLDVTGISSNQLLLELFPEARNGGAESKPTTGTKIRTQANLLYKTLAACCPHYVRCIKSNENKARHEFDQVRVKHQVQYLGLLDNIKVRRAGFAYRATYEKFLNRYALLSKQTSYAGKITFTGAPLEGCRKILQDLQLDQRQFQIGRTKIFLKDPETLFSLEDLRERYWYNMAARITNAYRVANSFQHTAATRVKNAFLTYKYYRQLCAVEIQRAYREFKKVQPYHDPRQRFEQQVGAQSQKSRQRFSLSFYRKFFGDYMKIQQQAQLMQAMAVKNPNVNAERPVFSFPGEAIIVPGIFGSPKISPRYIVLTQTTLYTIAGIMKKGVVQHKCERMIQVANIQGATFSTLGDNMIVIHAMKPDWDVVLQLPLKTELAAQLHMLKGGQFQMQYNDLIEWRKKKSSKGKLKFVRNDQMPAPKGMFKKYQMSVGGAMPPGSRMTMPQMYDAGTIVNQVQHLREAAVIITDDMLRAAGKRDRGARGEDTPGAGGGGGGGGGAGGAGAGAGAGAGGRGGGGRGGGAAPAGGRGGGRGGGGGGQPQGPKVKAQWAYQGAEADELVFPAGAVITVLKQEGDWWTGVYNGRTGLFPGSYCVPA